MPLSPFPSVTEQVAEALRTGILDGRWTDLMPGRNSLAKEIGVNGKTMEAALRMLQDEGLVVGQGPGRRRKIALREHREPSALRVAILDYDPIHQTEGYMIDLQHLLADAGHTASFTRRSLTELGMDLGRVARLVNKTPADAWIIAAGSRDILGWFAAQEFPTFALFGRMEPHGLAGAKPDKEPAILDATRTLISLGHRRIVMIARGERRAPRPGPVERSVFEELEGHGIPTGPYNLPEWEESPEGFLALLDGLFRATPPTALLLEEAPFVTATLQFCSQNQIRVPQDLSLISLDGDPHFSWCHPQLSHVNWESRPILLRIVRWANNVARGKEDLRQTRSKAAFVNGGTVGKVPS